MINIIVAPNEQNAKAEKIVKKIVRFLKENKEEFSVYFLHSLKDMAETVKEITSLGGMEFVVVGDDVVINQFLNEVKDLSKIKLGIVPTSKKDDFASYIGISSNPLSAIKEIVERNIEQVDLLLVNNNIKAINSVVVGASVDVYEKYSQFKIKNTLSEKIAVAKYASKFNRNKLTLSNRNGKSKTEDIFELVVANGGKSRGKLVSPLSNVKDGLFNVSYSLMSNKSENLKHLKLFNKGKHIYQEDTKQHWLNNLKITNEDNKIKASIDGNIQTFEKIEIVLIENGLKIYKAQG